MYVEFGFSMRSSLLFIFFFLDCGQIMSSENLMIVFNKSITFIAFFQINANALVRFISLENLMHVLDESKSFLKNAR